MTTATTPTTTPKPKHGAITDRIVALSREGKTPRQIAAAMGIKAVQQVYEALRRRGAAVNMSFKSSTHGQLVIDRHKTTGYRCVRVPMPALRAIGADGDETVSFCVLSGMIIITRQEAGIEETE